MAKDNLIAQNRFMGGMVQDNLDSLSSSDTYWYARNAIHATRESKNFGITNEGSTDNVSGISGVVGTTYCEERNWTFIFHGSSSISIFNHGNKETTFVMSGSEFGCDWGFSDCEWIGNNVQFKSMDPCSELHVYFSSNCEYYKVNVDLMLDPDRKAGLQKELACDTKCGYRNNCEYFKIFKQGCAPKITPKAFQNGGGGGELKAGAYTFVTRLVHTDGGETNWFHFSDPVFIGSEHNIAGEPSSSYIEVSLSCLDCKFASMELAVIEDIGGKKNAKILNNFHYGNHHFTYRYNGTDGTPISLKELLGKEHTYLKGKHLEQKDGHMLYYGIRSRKNPNLQPLVNQIQTEYVVYEMPYEHVKKYNIRSMMRDETYAFAYIPNYIDGSHGVGFHIPAGGGGGGNPGNQVSSVSEHFAEEPNDNADLSFTGGFSFGTGGSTTTGTSEFTIACEFRDVFPDLDVNYNASKTKLSLYLIGDNSKTDIIDCIRNCIVSKGKTVIYIRGHNEEQITFQADRILNEGLGSTLTVGGTGSQVSNGTQAAAQITAVCYEEEVGGGGGSSSSGGSGGGAASGGGQSQSTGGNAEITKEQEVERTRGAIPDRVWEPQNDHYDDIMQEMVDQMDTDARTHQCDEILLWQSQLKAQCCLCTDGSEDQIHGVGMQNIYPIEGGSYNNAGGGGASNFSGVFSSAGTGTVTLNYKSSTGCGACSSAESAVDSVATSFPSSSSFNVNKSTVPLGSATVPAVDVVVDSVTVTTLVGANNITYENLYSIIDANITDGGTGSGGSPNFGDQGTWGDPLADDNAPETLVGGFTNEGCCPSGPVCPGGQAYERCIADIDDPDNAFANWEDLMNWYNQDELTPQYDSDVIYQGARSWQDSIQRRERFERKRREWTVSKSASYGGGGGSLPLQGGNTKGDVGQSSGSSPYSGPLFDCFGNNETEVDIVEVSSGATVPDPEQDILYPCQTDCNGEFIYGGLAGTPVRHHKFPDVSQEPHFVSKSLGVPFGRYWTDAGETSDLYIRIMGVRFKNVPIPDESLLPLPLCPHNPYTIAMVKRTPSNRKVIIKGLATGTFVITNNGKTYDQPRYGTNSMEEVSYYHDDGQGNRLSNGGSGSSHTMYSLDGATIRPALHAETVKLEATIKGEGERYGLYAKGTEPEDALKGRRKDALGARQSINLHEIQGGGGESELTFKKYANANDSIAPGAGGSNPLMNRSHQECIWFGSGLAQLTDKSFTGDVLEHNVPIPEALGQYVSFKRDLPNQYGNLENLNYIPLLHAGRNTGSTIEGPVGDTYIGPYSFVKTGFVSDKVGSCLEECRYDIPAQVPTKHEKRCICDGPEDVIHHQNGAWVWTELPEDGDAADPKNWAGTQSEGCSPCGACTHTRTYQEAVGNPSISDFYMPGTTTSNITYVGEFEACPWLREKSDLLYKQWYSEGINWSKYRFDSGIAVDASVSGWEDCFLNQYHRELVQASVWQRVVKALVRTSLNIIFPMMGLDTLFDADNGGIDFVGTLAEWPMLAILWYVMVQVLFRNEMLDKLLGIPVCKDDEVGGMKEGWNKGLYNNPGGYNTDYSTLSDLYTYEGMPDPYHVCLIEGTEILMSDRSRKKIEDITINDEVLSYDFEKGEYINKKVSKFWDNGERDVYRIQFRGSYVDATIDHRWFVRNRNKRDRSSDLDIVTTRDLLEDTLKLKSKRKYSIVFSSNIPNLISNHSSLFKNKYEAYLFGMYIAEGCSRHKRNGKQKGIFLISQSKKHTLKKLLNVVEKSGLDYTVVSQGINIRNLNDDLENIFLNCGSKFSEKHIPEIIFKESNEILESIYEGLMDGDGHITKKKIDKRGVNYNVVEKYHTSSEQLNKDIRLLSRFIGKPHYTSKIEPEKWTIINDEEYVVKEHYISSYNKNSFLVQDEKQGTGKLHIQSITKLENKGRVYDIEIEDTHSFILADSGAITHNCDCDDCHGKSGQTSEEIYISDRQIRGSRFDAYTHVKPTSKIHIPASFGKLTNLFIVGGDLYAHTTDAIVPLRRGRAMVPSDFGEILLGAEGFLLEPEGVITEGITEGYAGLRRHNEHIDTQFGYFWVDGDADIIYRFQGQTESNSFPSRGSVEAISAKGMWNFFKEKLNFCTITDCIDERVAGTAYYALGVDPRFNRFLVTKSDGDNSFTTSYDLEKGVWISLHDYIPRSYIWDRRNMYSLNDSGIWVHNKDCNFQTYYGDFKPFEVQFIAIGEDVDTYIWQNMIVNSEVEKCSGCSWVEDIDVTFNKMAIWNSTQGTGTLDVEFVSDNKGAYEDARKLITEIDRLKANKKRRFWRINEIHDYRRADCRAEPFTICEKCQPIPDINESIFDKSVTNQQNFRNKVLADKYTKYRFIYDLDPELKVNLIYVNTYGQKNEI